MTEPSVSSQPYADTGSRRCNQPYSKVLHADAPCVSADYPTGTSDAASPFPRFAVMIESAVLATPTVLLYSPRPRDELDYQSELEAVGYRVVRSATVAGCLEHLEAGVDVVVLDDPPWELARTLAT